MSLPTVAPVPAPTLPCSSVVGVLSSASRTAEMPASMSGRTVGSPKARSKMQLEHTMGTCVGPTGRPMPRLSSSPGDAACGFQTKGRSTRKADGVDLVHGVLGTQQVGLARCRGTRRERQHRGGALGCPRLRCNRCRPPRPYSCQSKSHRHRKRQWPQAVYPCFTPIGFPPGLMPGRGSRAVRQNCRRWGIPSARCNYDSF